MEVSKKSKTKVDSSQDVKEFEGDSTTVVNQKIEGNQNKDLDVSSEEEVQSSKSEREVLFFIEYLS